VIQPPESGQVAVKSILNLARDASSTVFPFASNTVTDINGNALTPRETTILIYIPDTTPPQLSSLDIDLSYGNVTLHFNEPVVILSIDPRAITIQNNLSVSDIDHTYWQRCHHKYG